MAFVSGSAWIERGFADGMRKCLIEEFSDLYVFHLRGDIRKNMLSKGAAREGQNVFDSGSMTGISIAVFVKNPARAEHGRLFFHDIGPDLTAKEKLNIIRSLGSINGIQSVEGWIRITPDKKNDWLDQVDPTFSKFIHIGSGERGGIKSEAVFETASLGINSNRDPWVYNFSPTALAKNMERMIGAYNGELELEKPLSLATNDPKLIKWSSSLTSKYERGIRGQFATSWIVRSSYRPYTSQHFYGEPLFVHRYGKMRRIFPTPESDNLIIQVSGVGARAGFAALMSNRQPDLHTIDSGQCFPLKLYEPASADDGLFATGETGFTPKFDSKSSK